MGKITSKIDAIVAQRKGNVKRIADIRAKIEPCMSNIGKLASFQARLKTDPEAKMIFGGKQAIVDEITDISVQDLKVLYNEYYDSLVHLQKRFDRDNVHISFIGSAGMGKSLVMQKISGLDGDIIPSALGGDCTGARSIITNADVNDVHAEIEFYTEYEIVTHINKYLDAIFSNKAGRPSVSNVYDLKGLNFDDIKSKLTIADTRANGLLKHLRKYVEHIDECFQYLGKKITVPKEEIEEFVAQYKSDDPSHKYYKYLGVKTANILCKFPYEDAGKIVLLDTIGIGTISLGSEEQMFETIRNDSDAIVWMFKPGSQRARISEVEQDTMIKVQKQIGEEYTSNMMFCVINQVCSGRGKNDEYCVELQQEMKEMDYALADVLTLDCNNEGIVKDELLNPVLTQLSEKLVEMDKMLLLKAGEKGKELFEEYAKVCEKIDNALVVASSEEFAEYLEINNLVEDIVGKKLAGGLRAKSHDYCEIKDSDCKEFKEKCEKFIKRITKTYPSREQIKDYSLSGEISQANILEKCTDLTRYNILETFLDLNETLNELVKNMKIDIIHILTDADKANLGVLLPFDGENPDLWIENFIKKIEKRKKYYLICSALSGLRDFNMNVKGYLIPVVRDVLADKRNGLDFKERNPQNTIPTIEANPNDTELFVEEVQEIIKSLLYDVKDNIEKAFDKYDIYKMPNKALYAASRDFYDRSTFSANEESTGRRQSDVKRQWRALYKDKEYRAKLWRKEYEEYCCTEKVAEEWEKIQEDFAALNQQSNFIVE